MQNDSDMFDVSFSTVICTKNASYNRNYKLVFIGRAASRRWVYLIFWDNIYASIIKNITGKRL